MANIIESIKKAKKRGASDEDILKKIIEDNPQKADQLKEAKKRGASASDILEKIIKDNRPSKKEKEKKKQKGGGKKKKKDKDKKQKKKSQKTDKKDKTAKKKEEVNLKERFSGLVGAVKSSQFVGELLSVTRSLLVGVDISDHSIEVLLLNNKGNVTSYGRTILDKGIVENGEIINQKELSESLKETLRNTKPQPLDVPEHAREKAVKLKTKDHQAIISLPDSRTYAQVFKFEDRGNLYQKIQEEVKNSIPFDSEELYWDFVELPAEEGVKILCVAAQRDIVDMYIYFFKSTNIDPVAFEVEGASIGRAILPVKTINKEKKKKKREVMADGKSRMVIDMGAKTSILSIFNKEADLAVSVSLPYAGHYFTKKVSEFLDVSKEKAEKIKQKDGFKEDADIFSEIKKHGEKIVKEIERASKYYTREFDEEIKEIVLAGGTALLPDIDKFLDERVEPKVKKGNPLKKISNEDLLSDKKPILYSNVIGLGLRSLVDDPVNFGINLLPDEVKSQAEKSQKSKYKSVLVVSLFITIAGLVLLGLSIYYLIYLPVPAPIQPLQDRVLTEMQQEGIQEEEVEVEDRAIILEEIDGADVYDGPGEEQEVLGVVEPGESYRATGQSAGWVRIEFEDTEGWIDSQYLSSIETVEVEDEEDDYDEDEEEQEIVDLIEISEAVGPDGLNLRAEPTTDSEIVTSIPAGEVFEILDEREDWIMIEQDGQSGWASIHFVEEIEGEVGPEEEIEDTIERLME